MQIYQPSNPLKTMKKLPSSTSLLICACAKAPFSFTEEGTTGIAHASQSYVTIRPNAPELCAKAKPWPTQALAGTVIHLVPERCDMRMRKSQMANSSERFQRIEHIFGIEKPPY